MAAAGKRINAGAVFERVMRDVYARRGAQPSWRPTVCAVRLGPEGASWSTAPSRHAQHVLAQLGTAWETREMSAECTSNEVLSAVAALNADERVDGILIVRPVPDHLSIKVLRQAVDPRKDIEGMHPGSVGRVVYGPDKAPKAGMIFPSTAKAAVEVMRQGFAELGTESLQGLEALVIGSSDVLAKPIGSILHAEGATVTVCPPGVSNLAAYSRSADAVFSAANTGAGMLTGGMLKPGAVLVDLGVNLDAEGRFVGGDADLGSCAETASKLSSLSHGVGKVRSAVLCQNLMVARARMQESRSAA